MAELVCELLDAAGKKLCPPNAAGQVTRVARRFALCLSAGELAASWGILPWGQEQAFNAAQSCFNAWLEYRGGVGTGEERAVLDQVRLFIEQHGASRFQDLSNPNAVVYQRAGFRDTAEDGNTYFYVLPEVFRAEICRGHNQSHAARALAEAGLLERGDGRNYTTRMPTSLPGLGKRIRCYKLCFGGQTDERSR